MYTSGLAHVMDRISRAPRVNKAIGDHGDTVVHRHRAASEVGIRLGELLGQVVLAEDVIVGVGDQDRGVQLRPCPNLVNRQRPVGKCRLGSHAAIVVRARRARQRFYWLVRSSELTESSSHPQAASPVDSTAAWSAAMSRKIDEAAVAPHMVSAASTIAAPV